MRCAARAVAQRDRLRAIAERGAVGDAQRAADNVDAAVEGVRAAECDGACIDRAINLHAASAGDGVGHFERAGAVKTECAIVDHIATAEAAGGSVVANLQRAGADGSVASVCVRSSEDERAGAARASESANAAEVTSEDKLAAVGCVEGRVGSERDRRVDRVGQRVR